MLSFGPCSFSYVNFLTDGLVSNFDAFADEFRIYLHYNSLLITFMACMF